MNHEQSVPLVSDWARGRLEAARAREVEAHVRICHACSEAAEVAAGLGAEAERLAAPGSAHPSSVALARYVEMPEDESTAALARIGAHLLGCQDCREDVALMREARAPGWWRSLRSWVAVPGAPARLLQPALAVAAVLLAYPAWVGLVEYPRTRAAAEQRLREAEARAASRPPAPPPPDLQGGGVAALVLRGATRSGAAVPTLRLRGGQDLQPVLVDVALPAGPLVATVLHDDGRPAWSVQGPRDEFWDATNQLAGFLVPARALPPGDYRLELRSPDDRAPFLTARFRVLDSR
jgi:hypothetical protein